MDLGADRETYAEQRARSTHATVGEVIIVRIAKVRRGPPADGPLAWPPERMPDTARKTAPAWLSTDAGADDDADDEDYVLPGAHAAPGGARSTRGRRRGHRPFRPADCDAVRQGDQPAMQGGRGGARLSARRWARLWWRRGRHRRAHALRPRRATVPAVRLYPSAFAGSSQSRVPMRSRSTLQLRCILAGHLIGEAGYEGMRGPEASRLMLEWGTASFAKRYPKVPEVAASPSSLPMLPRTAQLSPSELTPLLMTAKPKLEARLLKEAQHELRLPAKTRSKA